MNETAPKGLRLHLGIFGRRNAGKSTLLNAITRQNVSIVSDVAGTTTDPVEKPMELLPIGPVLFIDTAGIDDVGALGEKRAAKTRQAIDRTDVALLALDLSRGAGGEKVWDTFEEELFGEFTRRGVPVLAVLTKADLAEPPSGLLELLAARKIPHVRIASSAAPDREGRAAEGVGALREALVALLPEEVVKPRPILSDLVPSGALVVLVTPIDKEAPKGRLIMPQVQTIRDLLDAGCSSVVTQVPQLPSVLARLAEPPAMVVTDSQAFREVDAAVPESIPLTSFSVLFARVKGDFGVMKKGAETLDALSGGARILIAEACSHHPIAEDIGTEKIPRLLRRRLGDEIEIGHVQGHNFPETDELLAEWDLVIHCGACVWNRREMLRRIARCEAAGVPITNYGLALAQLNGILPRASAPLVGEG
ncbi:MAG: [Thermoguttaceae bacterium]|nr:[FeFe] hydrogenase H-cluster maturation GTPase HydF [Thermoguttaceae bacterium]